MKTFLLSIVLLSSCISNEGGISINNSFEGKEADNGPSEGEITNNPEGESSSNAVELNYDFSDTSLFTQNFNLTNTGGISLNLSDTMPGTNSEAASCNSSSNTYKGCYQESIDTFNLPITIQFDFVIKNAWYTVTQVGFSFYESVSSFHSTFTGVPMSGEKLGTVAWTYSYSADLGITDDYSDNRTFFVFNRGVLGDYAYNSSDQRIPSEGTLKLVIDADGNFTYSFLATDGSTIDTRGGTLPEIPLNFKVRFWQSTYGDGSAHYKRYVNYPSLSTFSNVIDNLKIIYE